MPRMIGENRLYREAEHQRRLFTPLIYRPSLWLDAYDSPFVTEWRDKSGYGRNAINTSGANQPTYDAAGQWGRPAMVWPSTANNVWLRAGGFSWHSNRQFSNFIVARVSSAAAYLRLIMAESASNPSTSNYSNGYVGTDANGTGALAVAGTTIASTPVASGFTVLSGPRLITNCFGTAGFGSDVNAISLDGGSFSTSSGNNGSFTSNGLTVGAQSGDSWRGAVSEIIQIPGALSVLDRQKIEGYLAWKWKIPLAGDHPFLSRPPMVDD